MDILPGYAEQEEKYDTDKTGELYQSLYNAHFDQ
jgi:hypothetical protein